MDFLYLFLFLMFFLLLSHLPSRLQVTTCSWWRSTSWVTRWVWSTPTIRAPSWLLSISTWTRTTSSCLWTTCRASRRSTVSRLVINMQVMCFSVVFPASWRTGSLFSVLKDTVPTSLVDVTDRSLIFGCNFWTDSTSCCKHKDFCRQAPTLSEIQQQTNCCVCLRCFQTKNHNLHLISCCAHSRSSWVGFRFCLFGSVQSQLWKNTCDTVVLMDCGAAPLSLVDSDWVLLGV